MRATALGRVAALVSNPLCGKILVGKADDVQHQGRTRKLLQKSVLPDHLPEGRKPSSTLLEIIINLLLRQRLQADRPHETQPLRQRRVFRSAAAHDNTRCAGVLEKLVDRMNA